MNQLFILRATIQWNQVEGRSYLRHIPALKGLDSIDFSSPVTFFVGENGTGKSTLLEAIAVAYGFNPEGGTKNYRFSTYDSHSGLYSAIKLIKGYRRAEGGYFLRAESFYNVATKEMEYADFRHPSQRYHDRSHGESFMSLLQRWLGSSGVFLFDEPEAALSPQRQLTLLAEIYHSAGRGSQFLIATHSPILLALPGSAIFTFDDGPIHPCAYEETGSYQITKMFVNNRNRLLRELLAEEESPVTAPAADAGAFHPA